MRESEQATPEPSGAGTTTTTDWFGILTKITLPPDTGLLAHVPLPHLRYHVVTRLLVACMRIPEAPACMTCDAVRSLSFAAGDAELNAPDLIAFEAHLQRCSDCRTRCLSDAVFLRSIRAAVALDAAPQSLRDRIALNLQSHATENAST